MKPIIVIPAYQPDPTLLTLVEQLTTDGLSVVVVNDGSEAHYHTLFKSLETMHVKVLNHQKNLGKGQALKTALQYCLQAVPAAPGVVTADADGQHLATDIEKVVQAFTNNPEHLVLGARSLTQAAVPWRSRFGNRMSRWAFSKLSGYLLQDTQTGLRAIPREFISTLLDLTTSGYDFELEMLLCAARKKIPIKEVPITTIYKNANKNSHFRPIQDSCKVYAVFLRFLFK